MTLEMAVAPIALALANHPNLEDVRPVVPALHHVGGHAGERAGGGHGSPSAPGCGGFPPTGPARFRSSPSIRSTTPHLGDSTRPGFPPPGSSSGSPTSTAERSLPSGETGEIQVRSPSVMTGYLPAEATADAFAEGWYRTGDVGWLEPDGWVHLTDRSKEMIKVNGFQVAPAEIEGVLHGHPAVLDCAVFGLADERAGEVPVAVVQLDPDHPPQPTASCRSW